MSEEKKEQIQEEKKTQKDAPVDQGRRNILKALATLPVFGGFFYALYRKKLFDDMRRKDLLEELGFSSKAPEVLPKTTFKKAGDVIRLGIIGNGGRGEDLVRSAGFAHPDFTEVQPGEKDNAWWKQAREGFLLQEDMNVVLTGVCDVFDVRADRGLAASKNEKRPGGGKGSLPGAKRYRHYQDLLGSKDIDAVIIGTPDHWHAQMTIDAVNAGKHVYCEKCITRTEEEVRQVTDTVKNSDITFQLGHQNPQQETFNRAKEIVNKNILGKITLVETTTNRNSPNGAWVYDIHEKGSPETIDWELFEGPAPNKVPFSLERFFRWRCWYDYGTGLSGDLFSHEFDAVNQILGMGIPKYVTASGGIYFYKDGRDVPAPG